MGATRLQWTDVGDEEWRRAVVLREPRRARAWWGAVGAAVAVLGVGAHGLALPLSAQTFRGRVVDELDGRPIPTALVRLVDEEGTQLAVSIADSAGRYEVRAPAPGVVRLEAARLGFENFETPLLEATVRGGIYPVDLLLRPVPVPIRGFTIESRVSSREADRQIRLMTGIAPASMRYRPIRLPEIQDHLGKGRGLTDLLRWTNAAGLVVSTTTEGPCYSLRGRGCLPVYLNGMPVLRDFLDGVPLDMLHTIVVVTPTDGSMAYPGGAVLLYTEAWLR